MAPRLLTRIIAGSYRSAVKPVLFRFDPEDVHDRFTDMGALMASVPAGRALVRFLLHYGHPMLTTTVAGLTFENPIGLAAGFDKNARLWNILPDVGFGFAELGSITGQPCAGNPRPRLWRLPRYEALQVYYGLKNDGAALISERLRGARPRMVLGISAAKTNSPATADPHVAIADYCSVVDAFRDIAHYITVNISCPNAYGGQPFTDPRLLDDLLRAVDARGVSQPIFIKMSPDLTHEQLDAVLEVCGGHRITGFVCTNLTKDQARMNIPSSQIPGTGGISGRAVAALADAQLSYLASRTKRRYILMGCGGVFSAEDAYRKIRLGASLVQLITGMVYGGPQLIGQLNAGLVRLLRRDGFTTVGDAVGVDNTT